MTGVLKTWLRNRLGVTVDPNPDNFGEYARDGTLLARLLHSYDIINTEQSKIIKKTDDPALARVNLKHLKVWLRFFNVDISDDCIDDVSNGRGDTAARLFHQIYLYLADKDRLYFITEQRLRENGISDCIKFDVTVIPEAPKSSQICDDCPAKSSIDDADATASNRSKFQNIVDRCRKAREKCVEIQDQRTRCALLEESSRNFDGEFCKRKNECSSGFVDAESRRHEKLKTGMIGKKIPDVCEKKSCDGENVRRAEETRGTKNRTRKLAEAFKLKSGLEKALMAEVWDRMLRVQEKEFDEIIAKKLLCQSQFEKQMMTKLCEILGQKQRIIRNREIVERLTQEQRMREKNIKLARAREKLARKRKHIDLEYRSLLELRGRISAERLRKSHVRHVALCSAVLNDLVDMSIKAGEYRHQNRGCVPKQLWNEWRTLFLKCQPIFEQIETPSTEILQGRRESIRLDERLQFLSRADFDSYLDLTSPWDEDLRELDSEITEALALGIVVLGYIVHRLLRHIYPLAFHPKSAPVPKVSTACILLGVLDTSLYPIIQDLLKPRGIRLVRIEDAINYCLLCHENEMRDYGYVENTTPLPKESTVNASLENAKANENEQREQTEKKRRNSKIVAEQEEKMIRSESKFENKSRVDQETQTPRVIPPYEDEDQVLSQPANFGKWARKFLDLGQPISDDLCTNILIEYLKSLGDVHGWVLVDYPNTYNQMVKLESMLTGHEVPLRDENSADSDASTEETPRIVYQRKESEKFATFRESRLIPNPLPRPVAISSETFMTAYIRVIPMREDLRISLTSGREILPEDSVDTDAFYVEHGIAHALYYVSFDALTLKRLCRCIIGDASFPRVSSEELFGEALEFCQRKLEAAVVQQLIPAAKNDERNEEANSTTRGEDRAASRELLAAGDSESGEIKPGEKDWNWIDFPLPPELMESLARRWEITENTYLRDLREIFLKKRMHLSSITVYQNRITNHMNEFVQRHDERQDMLRNFQVNFNNVEASIRNDADTRIELHSRLEEFRRELWEICYEKRKLAENERRRIICENWSSQKLLALVNLFISMQQTELDRCIDTIQLLRDYYTSMLRKPIAQTRLTKYVLQFPDESGEINVRSEKAVQCGPRIDCDGIIEQVANLLIDNDAESFEASKLIGYQSLRKSLSFVQSIVDSLALSALEAIKKHETQFETGGKRKMRRSKKLTRRSKISKDDDLSNDFGKRGSDFCREWTSAVLFEINRIRLRMKLIDNVALSELAFIFDSATNTFHRVLDKINDRYKKEMESIDDMNVVFCSAIEEGISVPENIFFDADKFVVRSNAEESVPRLDEKVVLPSKFRMGQLGCLMEIFRRVAPIGSLSERSFVYILEDLLECGEEEGRKSLLPDSWAELSSRGVSSLVEEIFGDSDYADWREFIIYATDIPMPSIEEILDAKSQFMALDPDAKEMVNRDEYRSVRLWFSNCSVDDPACRNLLSEDLERDEDEAEGNEELDLRPGSKRKSNCSYLIDSQCMQEFSNKMNTTLLTSWNRRENLRLMLAKELLFELFLIEDDSINYTKFLLAFCKGPVPKVGLGKALGLALGGRVCIDPEEGERSWEHRRFIAAAEDTTNEAHGTVAKVSKTATKNWPGPRLDDTDVISATRVPRDSLRRLSRHSRHERSIGTRNVDEPSNAKQTSASSNLGIAEIRAESNRPESLSGSLADGRESFSMVAKVKTFYWIPREVFETVLLTALPHLAASDLHLRLDQVCEEISDASLGIGEGYVLSHRITNHEVVRKILDKTSRFTVKHIGNIVENILNVDGLE